MNTERLSADVEIRSGLRGDSDPANYAKTATLRVTESGFSDTKGVGRAGAESGGVEVTAIRDSLLVNFDRDDLIALLDHFVRLREALSGA